MLLTRYSLETECIILAVLHHIIYDEHSTTEAAKSRSKVEFRWSIKKSLTEKELCSKLRYSSKIR